MGNCYRKGQPFNPGEILDRVVANAEPECLLYNLANFKKGGQLIEAFNKGGSTGVRFFQSTTCIYKKCEYKFINKY